MNYMLILCGAVLLLCVASSKLLGRFGIPTLLIFLLLGMAFGSDGFIGIEFSNFEFAKNICSFALVFVMFYGGFGTSWVTGKPVVVRSVLMSTIGVIITAGLTGLFCHFVFGISMFESLLLGSVIASTDAASIFSILRAQKLNLKGDIAPLLEIESGSNDPFSYMLTIICVAFINNESVQSIPFMLVKQLVFGIIIGITIGVLAARLLRKVKINLSGMDIIFVLGMTILAFSLAEELGGNGYLSVYLAGIILGNSKIMNKKALVNFFDGASWLMQIMLFFTLGLLSFPKTFPTVVEYAVPIALFLIFIARPIATFSILSWFKTPFKHMIFISFVGLRGAASLVFIIFALTSTNFIESDLFHIVFFVALFSVTVQGGFISLLAKKMDLIDNNISVLKTFTDYTDNENTSIVEVRIDETHPYCNKTIAETNIAPDILIVMVKRGNDTIIPNGSTEIQKDDVLIQLFRKEFFDIF